MQTTKMRLCEDPSDALNFARNRRVLVQRQMRAGLVVICHVGQQYVPQVNIDHLARASPDSPLLANRIGFSTRTGFRSDEAINPAMELGREAECCRKEKRKGPANEFLPRLLQ
jgi:hypothetical protein